MNNWNVLPSNNQFCLFAVTSDESYTFAISAIRWTIVVILHHLDKIMPAFRLRRRPWLVSHFKFPGARVSSAPRRLGRHRRPFFVPVSSCTRAGSCGTSRSQLARSLRARSVFHSRLHSTPRRVRPLPTRVL